MPERFPRQFGKYVLLKSLARGGMGEIYMAASGSSGGPHKLCVIKKVITEKSDPAKVNRFLDEAKVVLRLSHGNLVSTFDAGDVSGELFIAMELIEGKDLREIWNRCVRTRTRIPVDVALVVVREIAEALSYVHAYGGLSLVHRDVAPPNILLSYRGDVKLTDFGLARSTLKQEHTAPGVVFGRASYLAPEQARGELADARTDVYSLGIVLWELLTGQPYLQLSGLDPVTSLSLVRHPQPVAPSTRAPWLVPELDAVALKALSAERDARFQSAEELHQELSRAMSRVAPQANSTCIARFLQVLYRDLENEERAERASLLARNLAGSRGAEPAAGRRRTMGWRPGGEPPGDERDRGRPRVGGPERTREASNRDDHDTTDDTWSDSDVPTVIWQPTPVPGAGPQYPQPARPAFAYPGRIGQDRIVTETVPAIRAAAAPRLGRPTARQVGLGLMAAGVIGALAWFAGHRSTGRQPVTATVGTDEPPARAAPQSPPALVASVEAPRPAPLEWARRALAAGATDDAVAALRPLAAAGDVRATPILAEALVASGWMDAKASRWTNAIGKAREALALASSPRGGNSHGAHALLAEALYARQELPAALYELKQALAESPGDSGLRRRIKRVRRRVRRAAIAPQQARFKADSGPAKAAAEQ